MNRTRNYTALLRLYFPAVLLVPVDYAGLTIPAGEVIWVDRQEKGYAYADSDHYGFCIVRDGEYQPIPETCPYCGNYAPYACAHSDELLAVQL